MLILSNNSPHKYHLTLKPSWPLSTVQNTEPDLSASTSTCDMEEMLIHIQKNTSGN